MDRAYRDDEDESTYNQKRFKRTDGSSASASNSNRNDSVEMSKIVAEHYNNINNKDISERLKSRIYYMRNFNNWIKSIIIRDTITLIRSEQTTSDDKFVVLDLGCGKGGDLIKFQKSKISHLVCSDIANISIEHCKDRFNSMSNNTYSAEFISLDCTRERIQPHLSNPNRQFDMTSCQFSFHYSFESYEQTQMMIQNAAELLKIGGIFCGTIPDSTEIMKRLKNSGKNTYGNNVYSITFPKTYDEMIEEGVPLFGARYNFHLDEVVDCPEFLVYFPVFEEICRRFGLKLIFKKRFDEFFTENKEDSNNSRLMNHMDALEKYPPKDAEKMMGTDRDDYKHIRDFFSNASGEKISSIGTLSKSEWEAVTLYLVFSFRKVADGPI